MRLERGSAASPLSKGSDRRWPIGSKNTPVRNEGRGRRVRTIRDEPGSASAEDHTRRAGNGAVQRRRGARGRPRKRGATDHPFEPNSGSNRARAFPAPRDEDLSTTRTATKLRSQPTCDYRGRTGSAGRGARSAGETRPSNGLPLVSSSGPQGPADSEESTTGRGGHNRNQSCVRRSDGTAVAWGACGPAARATSGSRSWVVEAGRARCRRVHRPASPLDRDRRPPGVGPIAPGRSLG